jgi:hypothetical protein
MDEPSRDAHQDPASGWMLGAGGLPKSAWLVVSLIAIVLGVVLLGIGYIGYGVLIVIVGLAAAVNLF